MDKKERNWNEVIRGMNGLNNKSAPDVGEDELLTESERTEARNRWWNNVYPQGTPDNRTTEDFLLEAQIEKCHLLRSHSVRLSKDQKLIKMYPKEEDPEWSNLEDAVQGDMLSEVRTPEGLTAFRRVIIKEEK